MQKTSYIDYDLMMKNGTNVKITEKEIPGSRYDMVSLEEDEFQPNIRQPRLVEFLENENATSITLTASGLSTEAKLVQDDEDLGYQPILKSRSKSKKSFRRVKTTAHKRRTNSKKNQPFANDEDDLRINSKQSQFFSRQFVKERNVPSTLRNSSVETPQKQTQKSILRPKKKIIALNAIEDANNS